MKDIELESIIAVFQKTIAEKFKNCLLVEDGQQFEADPVFPRITPDVLAAELRLAAQTTKNN